MLYLLVSILAMEKGLKMHEDKVNDKIICKLPEKLFVMSSGGGYTSNLKRNTMKQMDRTVTLKKKTQADPWL